MQSFKSPALHRLQLSSNLCLQPSYLALGLSRVSVALVRITKKKKGVVHGQGCIRQGYGEHLVTGITFTS